MTARAREMSAIAVTDGARPGDTSMRFTGRIALDDYNRCQSRKRFKTVPKELWPLRCWSIAKKGSRYCRHCSKSEKKVSTAHLPAFYRTHLSRSLTSALNMVAENEQNALELREELRLMRVAADEAVVLFGQARDMRDAAPDDKSREAAQALVDQASAAMKAALKEVTSQVLDAARVETMTQDVFSPAAVRQLVDQITRIAYEACGEEHQDVAERFNEMIRDNLRLLQDDAKGTTITPDADVRAMDDLVPLVETDI